MEVPTGSQLVVTTRAVEGANGVVSTDYEALTRDVSPGIAILFDEGRLKTVVHEVRGQNVICDVLDGGVLSSHKGISVPGATLTAAAMTDKDQADLRFGLALGVDLVAISVVRRAIDVEDLRTLMRVELADQYLIEAGLAHSGDVVIYVLGNETSPDAANSVKVSRVGSGRVLKGATNELVYRMKETD